MTETTAQNPFAPPRAALHEPAIQPFDSMVVATRLSRFLAVCIDSLPLFAIGVIAVISVAMTVGFRAGSSPDDLPEGFIVFAMTMGIGVLAWGLWNITLVYRFGQTFGKRVMGIRVVRTDGSRASFMRIFFLRWGVLILCSMIPIVGGLVSLVDPLLIFRDSNQCLHDSVADTIVATAASSMGATLASSRG